MKAVPAPLCEVGCAASICAASSVAFQRQIVGSQWSFETTTRRLGTVPQKFIDRTDLAVSAQGDGWREVLTRVADVGTRDLVVEPEDYLATIREAMGSGGAMVFVDDFFVPWLTHAGHSHGLLPHTLAVAADSPPEQALTVIEGHSWWGGEYLFSYSSLLDAAFPDPDVHGIRGRLIQFSVPEPRVQRVTDEAARAELARSATTYERASVVSDGAHGDLDIHHGRTAFTALADGLQGFRYVCDLAADAGAADDYRRDIEFGRYVFLRLADEVAFAHWTRLGSAELVRRTRHDLACVTLADDILEHAQKGWAPLWRTVTSLATHLRAADLDLLVSALGDVADEDSRLALRVAQHA